MIRPSRTCTAGARVGLVAATFLGGLLFTTPGLAQLSIGSTIGVLPSATPYRSLILGNSLSTLQSQWQTPANAVQQAWINDINGAANQATSGTIPTTFNVAVSDSSTAQAAALRYAMTGNAADLNKAVGALQRLAIPANNSNDFITFPEVLDNYLEAYDMIRGASLAALPQTTRDTIESRLLTRANALSNGNNTESNARMKIGATRALAGELLGNQTLLNRGLADIQANLNYSTTDDGQYADSQGHYLNYVLRNLAPFVRAYEQGSGVDLYPSLQPLFSLSENIRLPDGLTPNISDGLHTPVAVNLFTQTGNAADAASMLWYIDHTTPAPYNWGITNVQNNNGHDTQFFELTDFTNSSQAPTTSPTYFSPGQAKISVFRQDWGPTSDYLMLSPGVDPPAKWINTAEGPYPIPAFHAHNDTLEILLASQGQYLLVAPGYQRDDLSNSPPGFVSNYADQHNVILVDGDLGELYQGARTRPEDFVHTNRLDSTELGGFKGVHDFATVHTNYQDTDVSRSIGFPGEEYFVVFDRMHGASEHNYGFNLIGRGAQTVLTDQPDQVQVRWQLNGAQVIEHLVSTHAMSLTTGSTWMHDTFNHYESTQRMTASIDATDAMFLSVLETGGTNSPSQLEILRLNTSQDVLSITVHHTVDGWRDTILSQQASTLQTAGSLTSDGQYAYIREQNGMLARAMLAEATVLGHGGNLVLELDHAATLSLLFEHLAVHGTISADGLTAGTLLTFHGRGQIVSALLNGAPIPFANGLDNSANVVLSSAGELAVTFVPEPGGLMLAAIAAACVAFTHIRRRKA